MKLQFISSLSLACILALTACGKKATVAEGEAQQGKGAQGSAPVADITRPPELVVDKTKQESESNPDETISFDKWQKQQAADE